MTIALLVIMLSLFVYMVSDVVTAVIAGAVAGTYLIPLQNWLKQKTGSRNLAAVLTIISFTVPLIALLTYSWIEISGAAAYLDKNAEYIARRLDEGLRNVPFLQRLALSDDLPRWVHAAADSSGKVAAGLREAVDVLLIGVSIFLFTTFYVLTDYKRISTYFVARIPGRYRTLTDPIGHHIRAVIYGVLYGTFLTQLIKSVLILVMNLIWQVPLAVVLAIASFFIGLLPIVGSWTVYTPVAIYLMLWRGNIVGGVVMLVVGFVFNTLLISTYLRPKIAAAKSQVLNFYWMFVALVTGVYTFGLMGIIIGPVLLSILKAILDSLSSDFGYPVDEPVGEPVPAD